MDDRQIREAVQQQLEGVGYHPELKKKAMNYIVAQTKKSTRYPLSLRQLSLVSLCSVAFFLLVIQHNFGGSSRIPAEVSDFVLSPARQQTAVDVGQLLDDLNLRYREQLTMLEEEVGVTFFLIEGNPSYEIKFFTEDRLDLCYEIGLIMSEYSRLDEPFKILMLSENQYFVYYEINETLFNYLNRSGVEYVCP